MFRPKQSVTPVNPCIVSATMMAACPPNLDDTTKHTTEMRNETFAEVLYEKKKRCVPF